jgi:hypothetical protein
MKKREVDIERLIGRQMNIRRNKICVEGKTEGHREKERERHGRKYKEMERGRNKDRGSKEKQRNEN